MSRGGRPLLPAAPRSRLLGGALLAGALLAGALLAGACVWRPPQVGDPAPAAADAAEERAYQEALERHTARAELYALFDTRAFLATTVQAPAFREARARRLAAFRSETEAELSGRLERERAEAAGAHEFFLGVHVTERRFDELDRKDSVWRVALVTPAGEVLPLSVERVGRATLPMRALYPYMGTFWTAYRVRFPREVAGAPSVPPGAAQVSLQVASPLGSATLQVPAP
jgi:hypothetical protein